VTEFALPTASLDIHDWHGVSDECKMPFALE
jgi:hypothetical protein